jgi:glycosyltransferase involved in cell wall biosynthesis
MKVLLASLFHPELVRGGAQQICFELFEGLKAQPGVEPVLLAAIDPSLASFYKSGACITGFDGRRNEFLFLSRGYDYWWHKNTDHRLLESYAEFLREVKPDVVHFHHFLLLGLDLITFTRRILPEAKIVFTLHEFMAICAADGQMLRTQDRSLCTRASSVRCHQCIPERGPETFFMREMWVKRHLANVDMFTTPSRFMIKHFTDWGLDASRITHVTNGQLDYSGGERPADHDGPRCRFGFFGQMVDNKGVWLILQAVSQLRSEGLNDFVVEINGGNIKYATEERRREIEAFRQAEEALPYEARRVIFNGTYEVGQLAARMARVDWCIVPSVWWETFALVISEAWMFGRPVIASDVGAMRERVQHDVNGLRFAAGSVRALAETMRRAITEVGLWQRLSDGIEAPPGRDLMVAGMMDVYGIPREGDGATGLDVARVA